MKIHEYIYFFEFKILIEDLLTTASYQTFEFRYIDQLQMRDFTRTIPKNMQTMTFFSPENGKLNVCERNV